MRLLLLIACLPRCTSLPLTSFSFCSVGTDNSPTTAWSIPTSKLPKSTSSLSPLPSSGVSAGCGGEDDGGGLGAVVRTWAGEESSVKNLRFFIGRSSGCVDSMVWWWWWLIAHSPLLQCQKTDASTRFHESTWLREIDGIASYTPAAIHSLRLRELLIAHGKRFCT
jgi:hypothetical protein